MSTAPAGAPGQPLPPLDRRDGWAAAALAAALLAIYLANGDFLPGNDAAGNVELAVNLVEEGRYAFRPSRDPAHFTFLPSGPGGRAPVAIPEYYLTPAMRRDPTSGEPLFVDTFGPGAALTSVPVFAAARFVGGDLRRDAAVPWLAGKVAASLMVSLSAALVFLTARRWLGRRPALALAAAYGLGTCVWSVSSQTLWQHPATELYLALGTFFLVRARERAASAALSALGVAAATACRPTGAVFALAAGAWLLLSSRRTFLAFAAAALPVAAALALHNLHYLGSPFRFGQTEMSLGIALTKTGSADLWQTPLLTGLAGVLLSPSRGLLVFSPFLALAIPGAVLAWRRDEYAPLRPLGAATLLALLVEAKWFDWWGGWTYGYRRVVDLAPALALLAVPAMGWALAGTGRRLALAGSLAWSVVLQAVGAFAFDVEGWNARRGYQVEAASGPAVYWSREEAVRAALGASAPPPREVELDVDRPAHRHRLWSLRDNQIGYYLCHLGQAREARRRLVRDWVAPRPSRGR